MASKSVEDGSTIAGDAMPLDPFGFYPGAASAVAGLGGAGTPPDRGYAFHAPYIAAPAPMLRFTGRFDGLTGERGLVTLLIHMQAPAMPPRIVARSRIPVARLVREGGRIALDCLGVRGASYALLARLSRGSAARAEGLHLAVHTGGTPYYAPDPAVTQVGTADPLACLFAPTPATLAAPCSQMCTAAQFDEPDYAHWVARLGEGLHRHRKQWEFVFIAQVLERHGLLAPGKRGLGFGVGREPLPAVMAAAGVAVTATDLPATAPDAVEWRGTGQLMEGLDQLRRPHVCDDATLARQISFRTADMRRVPDDLRDFDFTWSACALEHLGSIDAGLAFIRRSVECLRPGGVAVHTTELNLSSNDRTLDHASTVLFRRRDIERLALELAADGHEVAPIRLDAGDGELDRHIDLPPYCTDRHLKIALEAFATTSFGFIVRRGGAAA